MAEYRTPLKISEFLESENQNPFANITLRSRKAEKVTNETTRPALSELGNRVLSKTRGVQKESEKETQILNTRKHCFDSQLEKSAAVMKKTVTFSDSTKSEENVVSSISKESVVEKEKFTIKQKKTKTNTITKVTKPKPKEKTTVLLYRRREDINLSRRSLSKSCYTLRNKNKKDKNDSEQSSKTEPEENENESYSAKLLNQVENIDSDDSTNLILVSEYVNDIYSYLYHLEKMYPIKENHLQKQKEVTPKMRAVLIDWINEIHYQFHLVPETFHMTVGIIDRYLQAVRTTLRKELQLVGITALFIATKYEELYPPEIVDFVYVTDDAYSKEQILKMERCIISALDFQVGKPLSIHFLRRFSKAAKAIDYNYLLSKYFIELVSIEYSLAHFKPSEIAASALFLAMKLLSKSARNVIKYEDIWTPTLEFYSHYSIEHLTPLVKKIAILVRGASRAKLRSVFKKYQSIKFERISMKSELNGAVIENICIT